MMVERADRRMLEQMLTHAQNIYSVEDDMFLYYCQEGVFHVVKGDSDWSMPPGEWAQFANVMLNVDDEYFVTGESRELKEVGFLGGFVSKYDRRKDFASHLLDIIRNCQDWA